jgi:hypothetical protein
MNVTTKMLLFVLCVDAFLFLGQIAVLNINPSSHTLDAFDSHLISQAQAQGSPYELQNVNASNVQGMFPDAQQSIGGTESGGFADIWNTIKSWIFTNTPLGIILQIIGAPYFFLKAILPSVELAPVVYAIGAIWYLFSLVSIISWALGRDV